MERIIAMSKKERDRMYEAKQVAEGKQTIGEMSKHLQLSYRQGKRIMKRYREEGDYGLCHRNRGRPSNRRLPKELRDLVLNLCENECKGWGPTLVSERLERVYHYKVDHETIRRWLIEAGIYERRRKRPKHRTRRERKEHFGEMIQMDGSFHRWLKGIDEPLCLMVMIDDATSKFIAYLCDGETTRNAMIILKKWIKKYGVPKSLYTDYNDAYLHDKKTAERLKAKGEEPLTQFGRACSELGIEIIGAKSSQAKGRVERENGTLQDRLVKELEIRGIKTIEEANKFLEEEYLDFLNSKFSVIPKSDIDYHRKPPKDKELDMILVHQEHRTVANDWTVKFKNRVYQILNCNSNLPPSHSKIKVLEKLDGSLHFLYRDWEMAVKDITEMERPKCNLTQTKKANKAKKPYKPAIDHPWRKSFILNSSERRTRQ